MFSNVKDQNGKLSDYKVANIKLRNVTLTGLNRYIKEVLDASDGKFGINRFELISVD